MIEHIHAKIKARTLSTHFHGSLEYSLKRLVSYRVEVEEKDGEIYFLHRVSRGSTDRSYGINVARMAGMPRSVIRRSLNLLEELETRGNGPKQLDLFKTLDYDTSGLENEPEPAAAGVLGKGAMELSDLNSITPLRALQILALWQQKIAKEGAWLMAQIKVLPPKPHKYSQVRSSRTCLLCEGAVENSVDAGATRLQLRLATRSGFDPGPG